MRLIKISLAAIVVLVIVFFTIYSMISTNKVKKVSLPKNQFTERIEKEIESLKKFPENKFCKDAYDNIVFLLNDYYQPHAPQYPYGRLGSSRLENNQWKANLESNLYSTYTEKFLSQAFYVFHGSEWNTGDLQFIRSEYKSLRMSPLLQKDSPVDKKFTEIQTILNKYDEIANFISACTRFSYISSGLTTDHFPISDVKGKISKASAYLNRNLENEYVNHCLRLKDGLKEIPQALFKAHVRYLDDKISQWSGLYSNYNSQSDYANNLYKPLKSEIDMLDNEMYNVANFDREYQRLLDRWSADNIKAFNFKFPTKN